MAIEQEQCQILKNALQHAKRNMTYFCPKGHDEVARAHTCKDSDSSGCNLIPNTCELCHLHELLLW